MELPKFLAEMDVYARRRLVAAAAAVAILVVLIAVIASAGGGKVNPKAKADGASKPQPDPLVAQAASRHVKEPVQNQGDGPFMTIDGRTVKLEDVPRAAGKKQVALTFDDGPAPLTPKFLDKLQRLRAPATFFVIGLHVGQAPELVKREAEMGMTVANHSYSHSALPSLSPADQRAEIVRTSGLIEEAIGRKPFFFRFPGQDWNFSSVRQMAQQGLVGVTFSIDTQDWRPVGTRAVVANALAAKPGNVIQMHDGGPDRAQTLRALGPIVHGLRRRGFELVTLDELYRPVAQPAKQPAAPTSG
jgi:peptidoglycan/xylan/chitin deacetylase (PgdA/CDA1 family)